MAAALGMLAAGLAVAETAEVETEASGKTGRATVFEPLPETGTVQFVPSAAEKQVPARFHLPAHRFGYRAQRLWDQPPVRVFRVTFPSPVKSGVEENDTVYAEYFQPQGHGPFPGVVVLHILGGEFTLSRVMAIGLAREGIAALFVKMPFYGERRPRGSARRMISRDPRETAANMTQAVLDIRRAAAWLKDRPEVHDARLGVAGISLGGIMSALAAAGEPRFRNVAVYLGGGALGPQLWKLDHPEAEAFRRRWLASGETRESFLRILEPVDPASHGALLRDRRILMVAASHDEVIPRASTMALWEAMGRPKRLVWLDAGHYTAIRYLPDEIERMVAFFRDSAPREDAPPAVDPGASAR